MADQEKDHVMPSGNVELQHYTAKSSSMSVTLNMPSESGESFLSQKGPSHSQRTTEFTESIGTVPRFKIVKHQSKSHAITGEDIGHKESSDSSNAGRHDHSLKSGALGLCSYPDCITCPADYEAKTIYLRGSVSLAGKRHRVFHHDSDSWARKLLPKLKPYFPVKNPHAKVVQQWNKFFVISCLVAIFIDPLFFFLLSVWKDYKCIVLNWPLAAATAAIRSVTDFIYLLHMLLQFRLAYVAPESRVVGAGELVVHPKKIAVHYLRGFFALDLFIVLPLPQVMIMAIIPTYVGSTANFAKNLLRAIVLIQYIPRIIRVLPLIAGQSASRFIFETAQANFFINLFMFVLAGHVVGSCWYLFGLQRVNQCLRDACSRSRIPHCHSFMDCGRGNVAWSLDVQPAWHEWINSSNSNDCFSVDGNFRYGVYQQVVNLTTENSIVTRYVYSLFWGFQQISTLAGNLVPSYFEWEVLFTMAIIGLGLLLFALLIGNMQNFLLSLGRRRLDMQLRQRDVERWMIHRCLPEDLKRKVRQAERFSWAATRGANEEQLLENLPEDLRRDIRRHLFKFLKKVRIFSLMDEPLLDAIFEKLRQASYIQGSDILYEGGPIEKMVFTVRGKMQSIGADGNVLPLLEGDVCGEELLTWYLEHSSLNNAGGNVRFAGQRLFSNRTVRCLTNVEAFALRSADLEEITSLFSRFLRHPRVQAEIRSQSLYWRCVAATRIQVAWRYRQKRLKRANNSQAGGLSER